ncbi:MAG: hypothetical protein MJ244_06560 [Clostridia bacterium]|nr:hypothetical protein [Clostridia bacterium]
MSNQEENKYCKDCKYLKLVTKDINRAGPIGECHRYPLESMVYTLFHWCGEFSPKPVEKEEKVKNKVKASKIAK